MLTKSHQGVSRAEKARLHRQRQDALARRQRQAQRRVASQRQSIPDATDRLPNALRAIEWAQQELRNAHNDLTAALTIASLNKAYEEFQSEGGVTANDWWKWLNAEPLYNDRNVLRFKVRPQPQLIEPDEEYEEELEEEYEVEEEPESA